MLKYQLACAKTANVAICGKFWVFHGGIHSSWETWRDNSSYPKKCDSTSKEQGPPVKQAKSWWIRAWENFKSLWIYWRGSSLIRVEGPLKRSFLSPLTNLVQNMIQNFHPTIFHWRLRSKGFKGSPDTSFLQFAVPWKVGQTKVRYNIYDPYLVQCTRIIFHAFCIIFPFCRFGGLWFGVVHRIMTWAHLNVYDFCR